MMTTSASTVPAGPSTAMGIRTCSWRIEQPRRAEAHPLELPPPGPGEVRVRVAWLGLCGSDLGTWRGVNPLVSYPRVPGHEISGIVEALGPHVDGAAIGEAVLVVPYTACGRCPACRRGRTNCCRDNQTLGVQRDGALAGAINVPVGKLMRAPGLSLRELALVEPLSVGFHAAARARIEPGEVVAVIGCGAVGIGAVAGAAARGAAVVAVDVDERKLRLAMRLGAASTLDARTADLPRALAALADGDGPAVAIEASGQPDGFRACLEGVAFAGRIAAIGYAKEPTAVETRRIVQKELDVLGSRNALAADFAAAAAWLAADHGRAEALVSRVVGFDQAPEALAAWDADPGAVTKILVDCTGAAEAR